jgi:hypothetical protein
MHIDIGAPENKEKKKTIYSRLYKKNEAEHIVDNMVIERVRLTLGKMRKIKSIFTL